MMNKLLSRHLLGQIIRTIQSNSCCYSNNYFRNGQNQLRRYSASRQTNSTILEINNGVGGTEAMLFASDMLGVYMRYFVSKSWPHQLAEQDTSDLGGIKRAKLIIAAPGSFENLIQEAGVHRVQRVPKTEKSGRMHTSTVTVAVMPESILDIKVNEKEIEWQTMRASGPGGQHVNKTETAVRLIHKPSKLIVECRETRSQMDNKKLAMKKLLERMQMLELEKITSRSEGLKRAQQGNADRNEKIRTYNFPQDRITDHRIGKSYYNLRGLMAGEVSLLDKMIQDYYNHQHK